MILTGSGKASARIAARRKLRSGYALPSFPPDTAPGLIPTPSDHLTPKGRGGSVLLRPLVWFLSALDIRFVKQ